MRKKAFVLTLAAVLLILDSRCAAASAREALGLCAGTLIPSLFPLFVVSAMAVPELKRLRIPLLARILGVPSGAEGIFLLGCVGGFPVGAACVVQAHGAGSLTRAQARRMLGLVSLCGPSFLFGVIASVFSPAQALTLFVMQLETALLVAAFWPGASTGECPSEVESCTLTAAVRRSISSMALVCAWVTLAAVTAGFLRRWLFPLLPLVAGILLTGLLELTNGVFSLPLEAPELSFLLCAVFICFGGISVLLQVGGLAAPSGLTMGTCIAQKTAHALTGAFLAALYLHLGSAVLLLPPAILFVKITVESSGRMVYNRRERKGSECCFAKRSSDPANTAASAPSSMKI